MFKRWMPLDKQKSALILGPRRAGKTTLVRALFPDRSYVTLDDLDHLDWAGQDPKGFIESLGDKAVIDEIQRAPKLTIAVKYAIDNMDRRFIMTGSSSLGLLDAAADTLAGRISIYSLPTACWGESVQPPTHHVLEDTLDFPTIRNANRLLEDALAYGQFPEVLMQSQSEAKKTLLKNYRDTYFTRDLMQLSNIENLEGLLGIFHNLARSIGSHLEVSNFAREAGLSHITTKKYLNCLHQSQLTFRLYGFQYGPAKKYIKAAKTYFADNGIIESLNVRMNTGQLLENFVIAEFEKRRKIGMIETDHLFYYKSSAGREIDLVFETDGVIQAIEIKSTQFPGKRDIRNLIHFREHTKRPVKTYLFYLGKEYHNMNDVTVIPVAALFQGTIKGLKNA